MKIPRSNGMRHQSNLWKGIAAGAAGGIAASFVMNQFQALLARVAEERARSRGEHPKHAEPPHRGIALAMQKRGSDDVRDDATMLLGNAVAAGVFDRDLTANEKHSAGTLIHYLFGATTGAAYGALAESVPGVTSVAGLPMGAFVWATADEGVVPALGLSRWPAEHPLSTNVSALASHLVYGLTAELVRWSVRKKL